MEKQLIYVYLCIFLYALCYQAQVPTLPYIAQKVGAAGTAQYGYLQSFFSIIQLIGGIISGPFKDKYGAKALLLLSFIASAICYFLTATATSIFALYMSRLATVMQHAMTASRALITDVSKNNDRAVLLGRNTLAYSIGATLGPALGGIIATYSLTYGAYMAAAGSVLCVALVQLAINDVQSSGSKDNHTTGIQHNSNSNSNSGNNRSWYSRISDVLSQEKVMMLLLTKIIAEIGRSMLFSLLPVLVAQQFSQDTSKTGIMLSYLGLLSGLVQGFLVGTFTQRFTENQILFGTMAGLTFVYLFLSMATSSVITFVILMIPLTICSSLYQTVITALLTLSVPSESTGTVIALDLSIGSAIGIFTPTIGGWLMSSSGGLAAVCLVSSCLYLLLAVLTPWKAHTVKRD